MNKQYKLLKFCDGTPETKKYWKEYKFARNQVTVLLRSAETQYWKEKFVKPITQVNSGKLYIT